MNAEIQSFIKIWSISVASQIYCYFITGRLPSGTARLLSLLPVFYLFTTLPLQLTSIHLATPTIFCLVWLGNSKLLLFAFDQGPLASTPPLSLLHFISIGLLPIKAKQSITSPVHESVSYSRPSVFALKIALLAVIVRIHAYGGYIRLHPYVIYFLYCIHIYLAVELVLAITVIPVSAINLGLDLEPQFNEPYRATSLQDFWGRRWNLMATSILRPTVYHPVLRISTPILGTRSARLLAIFATFLVSGLMHEVIYYYLSRENPTWEVTWFFVLHGISVAVEVAVKKAVAGRWLLYRVVSGLMTVAFVGVTGVWLFFPQAIRYGIDKRAIGEYSILVEFVSGRLSLLRQ